MGANVCVHRNTREEQALYTVDDGKEDEGDIEDDVDEGEEEEDDNGEMANLTVPTVAQDNLLSLKSKHLKVPLRQGRGLMDWIKVSNNKDLSGTGGRPRKVTEEELAKHCTQGDCWMIVHDKVYNVSAYMEYHPGGELELMRGAGTDATPLFTEIHPWVNYESMLRTCLVGQFVGSRTKLRPCKRSVEVDSTDGSISSSTPTHSLADYGIKILGAKKQQLRIGTKWRFLQPDNIVAETTASTFRLLFQLSREQPIELSWNNPKLIGAGSFELDVELTGAVQIDFHSFKDVASFGQPDACTIRINPDRHYRTCIIGRVEKLTHDTYFYRVDLPAGLAMRVPIGHHVFLKVKSNGKSIERPYTPVLCDMTDPNGRGWANGASLFFIIKVYPNGAFTQTFSALKEGSSIEVSDPSGSFESGPLKSYDSMCLLAAGTGFTPMAKIIRKRADMGCVSGKKTKLLMFNKTKQDIACKEQLEELESLKLLEVVHVLSQQGDSDWAGLRGRVTKALLKDHLPSPGDRTFICVCGPDPFTQATVQFLGELAYENESVHVFQG
uniref:Cytochrome-b5 reductase n=1 Tax=Plectus sambesii TaxID=2011161 RepID=A0A914WMX5_9BILA